MRQGAPTLMRFSSLISAPGAILALCLAISATAAPAPTFKLPDSNGKLVELSDYEGQVVYIDFWASWCKPCRKSFPWMSELQTRYDGKGLVVIAINLDEVRRDADAFIQTLDPKFKILFDQEAVSAGSFGVRGMPSSYLIDQEGRLVSRHIGFREAEKAEIESRVRDLLEL